MIRSGKYNAKKTVVDGFTFDSKKEALRYRHLKILEQGHVIFKLELQPKFPIEVNGKRVCSYIADFRYVEKGITVIEDVKGVKTSVYNLKKKLMKAVHGIDILET